MNLLNVPRYETKGLSAEDREKAVAGKINIISVVNIHNSNVENVKRNLFSPDSEGENILETKSLSFEDKVLNWNINDNIENFNDSNKVTCIG